jgi:hypothetical protein
VCGLMVHPGVIASRPRSGEQSRIKHHTRCPLARDLELVERVRSPSGFCENGRLHLNRLIARLTAGINRAHVIDADRALGITESDLSPLSRTDLLHLSDEGYRRLTVAIAMSRPPAARRARSPRR